MFHVKIDGETHQALKVEAARRRTTMMQLLSEAVAGYFTPNSSHHQPRTITCPLCRSSLSVDYRGETAIRTKGSVPFSEQTQAEQLLSTVISSGDQSLITAAAGVLAALARCVPANEVTIDNLKISEIRSQDRDTH